MTLPADYYADGDCECPACSDGEQEQERDTYHTRHGVGWQEARQEALERAGYECQVCGISEQEHKKRDDLFGGGLHVHHKTATSEGGTHAQENLAVVCARCHPPEPSADPGETALALAPER